MTDDGTRVFFTSRDQLTSDDQDESIDLFETEVTGGGEVNVRRVSTGRIGDREHGFCDPVSDV